MNTRQGVSNISEIDKYNLTVLTLSNVLYSLIMLAMLCD